MKTDIEIAQAAEMLPIAQIARQVGLDEDKLEYYGKYKAKVDTLALRDAPRKGKLILVTAINPTPAGEGKTTTSVGLGDALHRLGKKAVLALREPSLGPVFGVKGGAAGGGYAQVVPMEDINLHFTGDFHATTSTPSAPPTTCSPPCWTTTSSRGTPWTSTSAALPGSGVWT